MYLLVSKSGWSRARRDRRSLGRSTVVCPDGTSRLWASRSQAMIPARYARTVRYTLEREWNRTTAMSVGLRPATHNNTTWRAGSYSFQEKDFLTRGT
jgi:hypothetical protein